MKITKADLEHLPDTVIVSGLAIHRAIYIDDVRLDIEPSLKIERKSPTFDWSYKGSGPAQAAVAIIANYFPLFPEEDAVAEEKNPHLIKLIRFLAQGFLYAFIAQLPNSNFSVKLKFREFLTAISGLSNEPVKATSLYESIPVDLEANSIMALGLAGGGRSTYIPYDEVKNKVQITKTGEDSYDVPDE